MKKYHVNKKGVISRCFATVRKCPYENFESIEECKDFAMKEYSKYSFSKELAVEQKVSSDDSEHEVVLLEGLTDLNEAIEIIARNIEIITNKKLKNSKRNEIHVAIDEAINQGLDEVGLVIKQEITPLTLNYNRQKGLDDLANVKKILENHLRVDKVNIDLIFSGKGMVNVVQLGEGDNHSDVAVTSGSEVKNIIEVKSFDGQGSQISSLDLSVDSRGNFIVPSRLKSHEELTKVIEDINIDETVYTNRVVEMSDEMSNEAMMELYREHKVTQIRGVRDNKIYKMDLDYNDVQKTAMDLTNVIKTKIIIRSNRNEVKNLTEHDKAQFIRQGNRLFFKNEAEDGQTKFNTNDISNDCEFKISNRRSRRLLKLGNFFLPEKCLDGDKIKPNVEFTIDEITYAKPTIMGSIRLKSDNELKANDKFSIIDRR